MSAFAGGVAAAFVAGRRKSKGRKSKKNVADNRKEAVATSPSRRPQKEGDAMSKSTLAEEQEEQEEALSLTKAIPGDVFIHLVGLLIGADFDRFCETSRFGRALKKRGDVRALMRREAMAVRSLSLSLPLSLSPSLSLPLSLPSISLPTNFQVWPLLSPHLQIFLRGMDLIYLTRGAVVDHERGRFLVRRAAEWGLRSARAVCLDAGYGCRGTQAQKSRSLLLLQAEMGSGWKESEEEEEEEEDERSGGGGKNGSRAGGGASGSASRAQSTEERESSDSLPGDAESGGDGSGSSSGSGGGSRGGKRDCIGFGDGEDSDINDGRADGGACPWTPFRLSLAYRRGALRNDKLALKLLKEAALMRRNGEAMCECYIYVLHSTFTTLLFSTLYSLLSTLYSRCSSMRGGRP